MTVQLRIAYWMHKRGFATAYQLAQAVRELRGEKPPSDATIYRLVRTGGKVDGMRADTLETLAAVFRCDVRDLFPEPNKGKK